MISIAIIGVLGALAVPQFLSFTYRARRAELPPNVAGIKDYEIAHEAAVGTVVACDPHPTDIPGKRPVPWAVLDDGFAAVGWAPSGEVRGQYKVTLSGDLDFVVEALSDVDGDSNLATYTATRSYNATQVTSEHVY